MSKSSFLAEINRLDGNSLSREFEEFIRANANLILEINNSNTRGAVLAGVRANGCDVDLLFMEEHEITKSDAFSNRLSQLVKKYVPGEEVVVGYADRHKNSYSAICQFEAGSVTNV